MDEKITFELESAGILSLNDEISRADDILSVGNSFFDKNYFGTRILILAPHPDDEINIAANIILTFAAAKAEIFVAYYTNGDFQADPNIRAQESVDSLKILGVNKENIIFLGYGDAHTLKNTQTISPAGHSHTYAPKNFTDYSKKTFGYHSSYTKSNFKRDLKYLILNLRANIIFCVDFDNHKDHRALSVAFEEVLGEILSERNDYHPEIYKKFAYATAFTAAPDFYAPNLLATRKPKLGETDNYDFDFIDRANYDWNSRIRFPVMNYRTLLKGNHIAEAIFAHKSQRNEWNSLRIINSDEIFFERRTDSQTYSAKITSDIGNVSKICDFKLIDAENLEKSPPQIENHVWRGKNLKFEWEEAIQVRRIVIYGNILDDEPAKLNLRLELDSAQAIIDKNGIYLDNVKKFSAKLPSRGRALVIDTEKIYIRRAEIEILESGSDFGLSEVEFFANIEPFRRISPFIKLTIGENFIYEYSVPSEVDKIALGVYKFGVEEPIRITATADGENVLTEMLFGEEIIVNLGDSSEIMVTAEVLGTEIYDRAIIRRVGDFAQIQLKVWQWLDKLRVHKIRKVDR